MREEKNWYESRSIWGGATAVAAGTVPILALVWGWDEETQKLLISNSELILYGLGSIVGGVVAIIGRLRAQKEIAPRRERNY